MTYEMDEKSISLCSRGFHFCYRMNDVFLYYKRNKKNKFAIVQPEGKILKGSDKSVCNRIKVVKVLSEYEVDEILNKENLIKNENDVFMLDVVRDLQTKFNLSVGGSVSLFIHGLTLNRHERSVDLDIVMPYYQKLEIDSEDGYGCIEEIEAFGDKASGNDFSETYCLTTKDGRFMKLDVRIKPEQKYDFVEYKGFKYKVCDIFTILEAKMRYAMEGDSKHRDDIYHLLRYDPNNKGKKIPSSIGISSILNFSLK